MGVIPQNLTTVMKRQNIQSIGDAIRGFLDENRTFNRRLLESRLINSWSELMGPAIASYTSELEIRNRKLYVRLTSSVLRHNLMMSREQLIRKINEKLGGEVITDIIFR
jgi:predicted nucleic acid-binding Zn ribbon protein